MKSEDIEFERNIKTPLNSTSTEESGFSSRDTINSVNKTNDDINVSATTI